MDTYAEDFIKTGVSENHLIDWQNMQASDHESDRIVGVIREVIWIRKTIR